jgi:NAD(P)H-hydrate epimerase
VTSRSPFAVRVYVVDAAGASAADAAAVQGGVPSRALMQRAGAASAAEIVGRFPEAVADGIVVAVGPGNNGGDGWVVASALHACGVRVRVVECAPAGTPDARAERESARTLGVATTGDVESLLAGGERLAVDALLGTGLGAGAPLRGEIAKAVACLRTLRERGAAIVALDLPTGLDASTGVDVGGLEPALTLTFGTVKRGHLIARGQCGTIVVLDIGLGPYVRAAVATRARMAVPQWFRASLPAIPADAHKGMRKKIAIVGGATGMAGAVVLAARAALRSGAGLVKCVVAPDSLLAVQEAEPAALAAPWPSDEESLARTIVEWADAVLVGPGLGHDQSREMVERVLGAFAGPVVLDADALNAFAGDAGALAPLLARRPALLTPHPAEFARLVGAEVQDVLAERFTWPARLAQETTASVLLKGVPTILSAPSGGTMVVAEGTPILAAGGAGDLLGGIAVTLLAQSGEAPLAGALAAFAHGRAATAVSARAVRGYALDDVLLALPDVWSLHPPVPRPPVLTELPAVGEST